MSIMSMCTGNRDLIFDNIYSDVWAYIEENQYENIIVFAQNWTPVKNIKYNVFVKVTQTGVFIFNNKRYNVARAYHPDFDNEGVDIKKKADVIDEIKYKSSKKEINESPFSKLTQIKEKLPVQKVKLFYEPQKIDDLKVGDKILRQVICFSTGEKEVKEIFFEDGKQNDYIIRANLQHNLFTDKAIVSSNKSGMIVIIDSKPSEDCIGFVVTHIAKSGKCAWAKEVTGSFEWLKVFYKIKK